MPRTADGGLLLLYMTAAETLKEIMGQYDAFQCRERLMGDCYELFGGAIKILWA